MPNEKVRAVANHGYDAGNYAAAYVTSNLGEGLAKASRTEEYGTSRLFRASFIVGFLSTKMRTEMTVEEAYMYGVALSDFGELFQIMGLVNDE